ncbi:peptidoglycan-associated lipoprotein Pal [Niveibacterium terrae]|uniref:peptidoglycan-associated lipoprotein Pal n=1 Tax=Niveibacterium terrae TaxID=3373598 RepID=UPI003A956606
MRKLLAPSVLALALAACGTTQTTQTPAQPEAKPAAPVATAPATPAPAAVDPLAAVKDANNILSHRSVYFDFDKYDIKSTYQTLVEAHAKFLNDNANVKILIQGNTDERGSREYNLALGQKRAEAVKKALGLLGAKEAQLEAVSLGEEKPKATGHGEEAWTENRRADILYPGEY